MKNIANKTDTKFAIALLAPSMILLAVLVFFPMLSNIQISFLDLPLNANLKSTFVGLNNYLDILKDPAFYKSLGLTIAYTALVVLGSTALGLAVAIAFNREFKYRGLVRSLIILSYVTPSISLIFAWKYMFNNGYGIINNFLVDKLHLFSEAPLWFDNPGSSFALVVIFAIWRYYPYAFISLLAILQTVDKSLYEAADIDGANFWQKFKIVTLPAIKPVLATVIVLRSIWMFYMFTDVYLLTNKVDILGVYLYKTAFAFNDLGKASAISVILFVIIAVVICFLAINLFPFWIMLMTSFKGSSEAISTTPSILPRQFTTEHFVDIFNPEIFPFVDYFKNSFVISLFASVIAVIIGIGGAYALARLNFKGRNKINASFYTVYMFSGILIVVPLFKIISSLGLYDTRTSLVITMVVQTLPTAIFMLRSYFETIPKDIEEAAMIDGLSRFQIIIQIMIPLAFSGIISVFVYCFMVSWNDFLFASIFLSSTDKFTLPIGLNTLFSTPDYVWGRMMAASLITALPVVIMYSLSERFIKGGAIEGGVKG